MKSYSYRTGNNRYIRSIAIIIGIVVNAGLSYICHKFELPIFLDTVGTMVISVTGGMFPGIITAVASNVICNLFDNTSLYFGVLNAIVAIFTALYVKSKSFKKTKDVIFFILTMGIVIGVLSGFIHFAVLSSPDPAIADLMLLVENKSKFFRGVFYFAANIAISVLDKAISLALALLVLHFLPSWLENKIRYSRWRQRPLSPEEIKTMDSVSKHVGFSVKKKITFILLGLSVALTILVGYVGIKLYFENARKERIEIAQNCARLAAEMVDGDKINEYIEDGKDAEGYRATESMLRLIRDNSYGVEYLYVVKVRENECIYAFDLETEDVPANEPGHVTKVEDAFRPYFPALLAGEEIAPIESDDISGWVVTAYYPIKNSAGATTAYAGADISMSYMTGYMGDFILRVVLIASGFFVLIIAYGIWSTGVFISYPVNTMAAVVKDFIEAGADGEKLDNALRGIRYVDIRTDDELEMLYKDICSMASNQTEQLRSIRRFSENTAKMQDGLIITMANLVEKRDSDTGAHIQKTSAYVKFIVEGLKEKGYYAGKLTPQFMSDVVRSAPLHDIGKINIPDALLNKAGELTEEEQKIIESHTTAGKEIIERAINTVKGENYLKEARNMAAYHHERWDGKGYPEGLHGEVIPLSARIMAVADAFDEWTSLSRGRKPLSSEEALARLQENAGILFDAKCVEAFADAMPEIKVIRSKYSESMYVEGSV
ncbi:MAG: HD domain-containing protein [Lachnospiraceae bacterium]|nr:HD domain-containing protein [Lachnospiraceae bacterium]